MILRILQKYQNREKFTTNCPHHLAITCNCRCSNPNCGLISRAKDINLISSCKPDVNWLKKSDILAAKKAGLGKNIYIQD
jgi:histidinol phosphatase-like enzyme